MGKIGGRIDDQPEWSVDGKRVFYRSIEPSGTTLKSIPIDGSEAPTVVVNAGLDPYSGRASHDGKWLVFRCGNVRFSASLQAWSTLSDRNGVQGVAGSNPTVPI